MKLSPYETFCLYIALKNHFTREKYDYHKYNGKTRISQDSFMSRRDRFQFQKLSKKYDANEMPDFIIANILQNKNWIGDLLEDDAHDNYIKYIKYNQSISYYFTNELNNILNKTTEIKSLFSIRKNQYPTIIQYYLGNDISIQTLSLLNKFIGFATKFDECLGKDDVLWSKIRLLCTKLTFFIECDRLKMKTILKEKIAEHQTNYK
jgi:hypothetical protein